MAIVILCFAVAFVVDVVLFFLFFFKVVFGVFAFVVVVVNGVLHVVGCYGS